MGFAEGSGLLFLAGMANGVRFFAPPYWKIDACAQARGAQSVLRGVKQCIAGVTRGSSKNSPRGKSEGSKVSQPISADALFYNKKTHGRALSARITLAHQTPSGPVMLLYGEINVEHSPPVE